MNPKIKTVLYIAGFVAVIAIAYFAYNTLMGKAASPLPAPLTTAAPKQTPAPNTEQPQETAMPDQTGQPGQTDQPQATPETTTQEQAQGEVDTELTLAPDFEMQNSAGETVKFSDLVGKPIVLNFWASWCPPCKAEMPHFEKLYKELGQDVSFIMLDSVDGSRETRKKGEEFIAKEGYTFPVFFDTEQNGVYTYGIRAFPTTIFIDKDGYIVTAAQSMLDEETLRLGISYITGEATP